MLVELHVVRLLADGSLDPAFGDGDGIIEYRRLVVELSDVAVQADGDLALREMPSATPSGKTSSNAGS